MDGRPSVDMLGSDGVRGCVDAILGERWGEMAVAGYDKV